MVRKLLLTAGAVVLLTPASAAADFGYDVFDATALNASYLPETQAGAHPFTATVRLRFHLKPDGTLDERVKSATVSLPAGFTGNPEAVAQCRAEDFGASACPLASQVGIATQDTFGQYLTSPVFNLEPRTGSPAQFGFNFVGRTILLNAGVRPGDLGVDVKSENVTETLDLKNVNVQLWGVPADPRHNALRFSSYVGIDDCGPDEGSNGDWTDPDEWAISDCNDGIGPSAGVSPKAFLSNPTDCSAGPLTTSIVGSSWTDPDDMKSASVLTHDDASPSNPIGVTGCDKLAFEPGMDARPTTSSPDAPAGLAVDLTFKQDGLEDPNGLAPSPLKTAEVTLPEGMTINPSGADGLQSCSDAQLGLRTAEPLGCPEASKVGTVTATTPLLKETLQGSVYVRAQASDDPASGDMFRVAIVLKNEARGLDVRLPGQIKVDAATGRIVTLFENNPQVPVDHIKLQFKGGDRAPLATPQSCGEKTINARFTSWAGKTVTRESSFDVDCTPGLGAFTPTLQAGTGNAVAAAFAPFTLGVVKPDGNSQLNGVSLTLPMGLLANLKGNLNTQVGNVTAYAGPGSSPFALPGKVYLEGRYGDAPFSLRVVVPAKAGPFDLGEVVVRQKIHVDPITAQATVVSDPLPTIVKGVPVRLQRFEVNVDKPGFIINPTSCAPKEISGTLAAVSGQTAQLTNRFQVSACSDLALKPGLGLSLSGKGQTKDGSHPTVSAVLSQPVGQANLKKVRVTLPLSLALDPDNAASDDLCSFAEGSKIDPKCPASSVVGKATAISSILNEPLSGPVYFVKNERKDAKSGRSIKTTPKLVIPLAGENGVKLTLTGTSTVVDDQLVTTFDNIPDAPVSSFKMDIMGGKKGILVVSAADICKSTQVAEQQIDGQNNKAADVDVYIQTPSCPLKVLSKKVGKTSVALKVGGLGAGKVIVTGRGIKKTTKTIAKSTVATITARRTQGKVGKATVSFDPAGPAKARKATAKLS